jgi:hypothetical protein
MHNGRADLLFPNYPLQRAPGNHPSWMGAAPRTALQIGEATMSGDMHAVTGIDADTVAIFHDSSGKTFGVHHATIARLAA